MIPRYTIFYTILILIRMFNKSIQYRIPSLSHYQSVNLLKLPTTFKALYCTEAAKTDSYDNIHDYRRHFFHLSHHQWKLLEDYADMLIEWNSKVNLISRKDIQFIARNHMIPSLSISLICNFKPEDRIIDVGTGGGLPGLVLAIAFPNSQFTLLDSNSKKIMVVSDIIQRLDLKNVKTIWARAETVNEKFDHLVGRAVSAIPSYLGFSSHLMKESKSSYNSDNDNHDSNNNHHDNKQTQSNRKGLWYLKGGEFQNELQEAQIQSYHLTPVNRLVDIDTDKNVLFIPSHEIVAFHTRWKKKSSN